MDFPDKLGCGGCTLIFGLAAFGLYKEATAVAPPVQLQNGYSAPGVLLRDSSYPGHLKIRIEGNIDEALDRTRIKGRITYIGQVDDGKQVRDLTQIAVSGAAVVGSSQASNSFGGRDEIIIRMQPLDSRLQEYVMNVRTDVTEGIPPAGFTPLALLNVHRKGDLISVAGLRDACCDTNDYLILKPIDVYSAGEILPAK